MMSGTRIQSKAALYGLFILCNLCFNSLSAEPSNGKKAIHNQQEIINSARQFLDENIDSSLYSRTEIHMGQLDPRLRLTQCEMPLSTSLAPGSQFSGKTTVHIRCNSRRPWTIYLSANIMLYGKVIKTAGPMVKDHILQKVDLILVEEDLSRLKYGYFTDTNFLIGKQLKRRLRQNQVVKANYVKAAIVIKRGELVSIVAKNSGYSVKMSGKALANGAKGDHIRVKNTSSKRIIEGVVLAAGIVSIN